MSRSYPIKQKQKSNLHKVYSTYLLQWNLDLQHINGLKQRGLEREHWQNAGYTSKKVSNSNDAQMVLGNMVKLYGDDLNDVPGFFINQKTNNLDQLWHAGMLIPVRNYSGDISYLIIKNDDPKNNNKYVYFSSGSKGGAKVDLKTHCPVITGSAEEVSGFTVRITEGVLKADIATALGDGMYCLGLPGLKVPDDLPEIIDKLEISTIVIALDAGEDEKADMRRAKGELIQLADKIGIDVAIETWDPELGKGIDDVLAAGHGDKIKRLSKEEIEMALADAEEINPNNGDWIYVVSTERFMNKKVTFEPLKKSQFADKFHIPKLQDVNDLLATMLPQVDSLTFLPGGKDVVFENGQKKLNLWRNPNIEAHKGDVSLFTKHMEYLFPNELYRSIVLDFLAFNIQFPGRKMRWALVVQGFVFGTGKSFLAEMMKLVLGPSNICSPTMEEIHSPYTHWQKNTQLVVVEELMARGRMDLMNKFKPMIVASTARIREMYTPEYDQPNRYNFLTFTNYPDPIILEEGDRRYGVVQATDADPKDKAYYDQLFGWLEKPNTAGMLLHYFQNEFDLSDFNHSVAPMTEAKKAIINISKSPLQEWVGNCIEDKVWPFNREIVAVRHLKTPGVCLPGFEKISDYKWAQALKKAGAERYGTITLSDKTRPTVWLIGDRKDMLRSLESTELAQVYEGEIMKSKNDPHNMINPIREDKL